MKRFCGAATNSLGGVGAAASGRATFAPSDTRDRQSQGVHFPPWLRAKACEPRPDRESPYGTLGVKQHSGQTPQPALEAWDAGNSCPKENASTAHDARRLFAGSPRFL